MNALLAAALARAREGAYVLPLWWTDENGSCGCPTGATCHSPGKHPRTAHGLDDASRDPSTIERWWQQWPKANIGVCTNELPRIDIDLVEAADLLASDATILAATEVVRTPRGGLHIVTRPDAPVATSTLRLADGRKFGDLKAARGYVVVPPSRIGEKVYERISPADAGVIEVDPVTWLRETLPRFGMELDEQKTSSDRDYRDLAKVVHEGAGRHNALVSLAGRIWFEGMAPGGFVAALRAINAAQCVPPLADDELCDIADHFIRNRNQTAVQQGTPRAALSAFSLDEWLTGEDEPLDVVIGDHGDGAILPIDGKGFVAGATGIGKTNLLLRLGRCLAEGSAFLGLPIPQPRRVLHIALEGSRRGMRKRLRKVWLDASVEVRGRFFLCQGQFNLTDEADVERLCALIVEVAPEVVIIDPLRNAHTWDENDSRETALLTATLDVIIARHHCALIAAHHDRKKPPLAKRDSGTDRIRGSTALAGWLSFCLSVEKDKLPDTLIAEWTKVRDAEEGLSDLVLTFDRETLDFTATERTVASKVADDDILTPVFHAGPDGLRGSALVEVVRQATNAGERTIKDRVREMVKDGRLIEFIAEEDRSRRAKSYRLREEDE